MSEVPTPEDLAAIEIQLGRTPRDVRAVSFRCPCGNPAVVETPPRWSDGADADERVHVEWDDDAWGYI